MATNLLQLSISRVDGPVFEGAVQQVQVPGIAGEMTILANHESFISPLKTGTITVTTESGDVEVFEMVLGTLEVRDNLATILI